MMEILANFFGAFLPEWMVTLLIILIKVVAIVLPLILLVAYATYAERKIIGFMQVRVGRTGLGSKACCSRLRICSS